jgi:GntR family transcriptional repressor for pyruvate dehydrogenase complex
MSRPFEPFERTTVSERVRDEIRTRITSGEISPGSQLPAERVLAQQFGVARTSVREAIQGLVALGFIERRGNRSFVVAQVSGSELPKAGNDRQTTRVLLEARTVLELALMELAAHRATARERNAVLDLARQPAPSSLTEFVLIDREFHAGIAGACDNPALLEVYGRVLETIAQADIPAELLLGVATDQDPAAFVTKAAQEHREIAEAFANRDIATMLTAVEKHLNPVPGMPIRSRIGSADGLAAYAAMKPTGP